MMGMIDASIDNNGEETNTLYQYYDEITKDTDDGIQCFCINHIVCITFCHVVMSRTKYIFVVLILNVWQGNFEMKK